jgi:LmbE family N-acetylglucosaminyl deacetylase
MDIKRLQKARLLCLGAHCDDIEIGCGGTLLNILQKYPNIEVRWIVFSSDIHREEEARSSANDFLKQAKKKTILINNFRNGFFPYVGADIKDYFEKIKNIYIPDLIFTHYRQDLHQDHRMISELSWNTFRNHFILEYEIPKYDGDFGVPNVFVPLKHQICVDKINKISSYFKTQKNKHWFTEELFFSTLRVRGMECSSNTRYAEAFYCRKMSLEL